MNSGGAFAHVIDRDVEVKRDWCMTKDYKIGEVRRFERDTERTAR
jgi:hypothetical protein